MEYEGFDCNGFMEYLKNTFEGMNNSMLRGTILNIINHAEKYENISKDMFCKFVSDMIDDVEFGEVAMFIDDKCLTEAGIKEKMKFKNNLILN